ncbi:uncharacterized protein [Physeter macrocephalus]|uniref:Uncharacterized protein isoform X3 n=1 Tax=Physeter macrocephalus TaxID=9755 RepID=A0A9W2WUK5_PHYMC|nr:uncharacterized protein LOC114486744 isoform X3 [Physeter catodon]
MELSKGCDPLLPSPTHTPCSLPGHKMAVAVSAITISHQCPGYAASPGERTWESVKKGAFAGVVLKNLSPGRKIPVNSWRLPSYSVKCSDGTSEKASTVRNKLNKQMGLPWNVNQQEPCSC